MFFIFCKDNRYFRKYWQKWCVEPSFRTWNQMRSFKQSHCKLSKTNIIITVKSLRVIYMLIFIGGKFLMKFQRRRTDVITYYFDEWNLGLFFFNMLLWLFEYYFYVDWKKLISLIYIHSAIIYWVYFINGLL